MFSIKEIFRKSSDDNLLFQTSQINYHYDISNRADRFHLILSLFINKKEKSH